MEVQRLEVEFIEFRCRLGLGLVASVHVGEGAEAAWRFRVYMLGSKV